MHFLRIVPEDLKNCWDAFRYGLLHSVPAMASKTAEAMQEILTRLLSQQAQGWVLQDEEGIRSIMVTYIEKDKLTNAKYLMIYALYGYRPVGRQGWILVMEGLTKFASVNRCGKIFALTASEEMKKLALLFGFQANYTLLEKEI